MPQAAQTGSVKVSISKADILMAGGNNILPKNHKYQISRA